MFFGNRSKDTSIKSRLMLGAFQSIHRQGYAMNNWRNGNRKSSLKLESLLVFLLFLLYFQVK